MLDRVTSRNAERLLSGDVEYDAEAGVTGHHAVVSLWGIFEREQFGHRCDPARGAEGHVCLVVAWRAGEAADDGSATEDEVGGHYLDRVGGRPNDHELTARGQAGQQR